MSARARKGRGALWRRRPRIFLHIGAMKSGTTYLQQLLSANRQTLGEAGFLIPGERWLDQSRAARDVLGFPPDQESLAGPSTGMWTRLADQMLAHRGTASIFSMEFLSFADPHQAARVIESLGQADTHVVLTVRDASATLPAQWQELCRNRGRLSWPGFLRGLERGAQAGHRAARAAATAHRTQGIPRMLAAWSPHVPPDHLHVVTVPSREAHPRLLWDRFAGILGFDPTCCAEPPGFSRPSLGYPSSELLRRVNIELGSVSRRDYNRVVRAPLGRRILGARAGLEPVVSLNRRGARLAARRNRAARQAIRQSDVHLVGGWPDLPVRAPAEDMPRTLVRPTAEELLDAAETAREGLLAFRGELEAKLGATWAPRVPPTGRRLTSASLDGDPVDHAVSELTGLVRTCLDGVRGLDLVAEPVGGLLPGHDSLAPC